jgi:DNA recombination protein RmuC
VPRARRARRRPPAARRRGGARDARGAEPGAEGLLQQQLVELRGRLDGLVAAQQETPRAIQEQLVQLSGLVTRQLDAGQTSVGRRLDETGRAVAEVRERLGQLAEATRRLEAIGASVSDLQQLLQVPKLRGTLGEVWLEELLRQVFPAAHYAVQHGYRSGERVDAALWIGERFVPVDAKFPLDACQRMLAASDDAGAAAGAAERATAERERRAFRRSLRGRIDEIAAKYIRPDEGTYDFALMYVPAERVYYEAIVRDETLEGEESTLAYAMRARVIPVSPHTFYAYLSAVLHGLKGLQVEARAQELLGEIGTLEGSFGRFRAAYEKVGTHLANAQKQYAESERLAGRVEDGFERLRGPGDGLTPVPSPA